MGRGKLTTEQQTQVVQALACFEKPTEIVGTLSLDHGVGISAQGIEAYDPTKRAGAQLSERWTQLFHMTRRTFLEDTASIGIAHRSVRLRMLDRMAARMEAEGNVAMAAQLLEQAAKEVGDVYTNRRQLSGANGGPIRTQAQPAIDVARLSPDDRAALRDILTRYIADVHSNAVII